MACPRRNAIRSDHSNLLNFIRDVRLANGVLALTFFALLSPQGTKADHLEEKIYQELFCKGTGWSFVYFFNVTTDRTVSDCQSTNFAWEVDFAKKWYEAIGQSLHYSIRHRKRAGIILVCPTSEGCPKQENRLVEVIETFRLPLTVLFCEHEDVNREQCECDTWVDGKPQGVCPPL